MSNKAYSFFFNASDWLSSPAVKLMSKAERGTYIDLLAIAWVAEHPGTLPASEDKVRRLAELSKDEWAESSEVLLEKFPLSECGSYRYNPRLLTEVRKQQELSEKNAENGRRSAERRAAEKAAKDAASTTAQRNGNENPTTVESEATTVGFEANESSTKISKDKQSTNVDEEREQASSSSADNSPLKAEKKPTKSELAALAAAESGVQLFTADDWPGLTNPETFASICRQLALPTNLDQATYRAMIQTKMRGIAMKAPASTMGSWIASFFLLEKQKGKPLLALVAPTYNETASNAQAAAITGSTIPAMSSMLKPTHNPH